MTATLPSGAGGPRGAPPAGGMARSGRAGWLADRVRRLHGRPDVLLDALGVAVLACLVTVLLGRGYDSSVLITALPYCIVLLGVAVQVGIAGQLSLAFPAFMAVGAFGSGVLSTTYGWPVAASAVTMIAAAGLVSYLLGRPLTRITGMALALVTVFMLIIVEEVIQAWSVLGGTYGLTGIPPLDIGGAVFSSTLQKEALLVVSFVVIFVLARLVTFGAVGRELRLLGHDESSARAIGVDVARRKRQVFVLSSTCAAFGGVLMAHTETFISPSEFAPSVALVMFVMLFFGGRRSLLGAAFGALFFQFLPSWITPLHDYLLIIEGAVFVIMVLLFREGIAGGVGALWRRVIAQSGRRSGATLAPTGDTSRAAGVVSDRLVEWVKQPATTAAAGRPEADGEVGEAAVAVSDVSKDFGGLRVLRGVSFEVEGPGVCAVVGPNGAGKTTLFNVISGEEVPTHGTVAISGTQLRAGAIADRRALGVVRTFQQVRLVGALSAVDNVALGQIVAERRNRLIRWRSREELEAARRNAYENLAILGCEYLSDRPAGDLTLAEQRLVELARATCGRGNIFLLDEPASGLSDAQRDLLASAVMALGSVATVVLVEHDLRFVHRVAGRVVVLDRGSVIFDGAPGEMESDPRVVEAYIGSEVSTPAAGRARPDAEETRVGPTRADRVGGRRAGDTGS